MIQIYGTTFQTKIYIYRLKNKYELVAPLMILNELYTSPNLNKTENHIYLQSGRRFGIELSFQSLNTKKQKPSKSKTKIYLQLTNRENKAFFNANGIYKLISNNFSIILKHHNSNLYYYLEYK